MGRTKKTYNKNGRIEEKMREAKLFSIGVESTEVAEELKSQLDKLKIEDENDKEVVYPGFISATVEQVNGETELLVYTYLKLEEFNGIVYDSVQFPKIFQYEKSEVII